MTARDGAPAGRGPGRPPDFQAIHDRCLASGCATVTGPAILCKAHWHLLPYALRAQVWTRWRNGDGARSLPYRDAVIEAVLAAEQAAAVTR